MDTVQGDPNTCGWIRSERQYEAYLRMMDERREKLKQHYGEIEDLILILCLLLLFVRFMSSSPQYAGPLYLLNEMFINFYMFRNQN